MKWIKVRVSAMRPSTTAKGQMFRHYSEMWLPLSRIVAVIEPEGNFGGVIIDGLGAFDIDASEMPEFLDKVAAASGVA